MKFVKATQYLLIMAQILYPSTAHLLQLAPTPTSVLQAYVKRDVGIATLTLGPVSEYLRTAAKPTIATGTQFFIIPGPQATDGIDVYMGPELLKSVRSAVVDKCMKGLNSECESSIAAVLPHARVDFQRKDLRKDVDLTALGILAVIVGSLRTPKREEYTGHWHLAEYEEWEGMKASPSPTIVVVSEKGDGNPYTIVSTNRPGPTVTSLPNGDTMIKFDEKMRHDINDFLSKIGIHNCGKRRKRAPDLKCVVQVAEEVLKNTLNGPLADLGQQVALLPQPGGPAAVAILPALVQFVASSRDACYNTMGYFDLHLRRMTQLELMVFWVVLFVAEVGELLLENTIFLEDTNKACDLLLMDECYDKLCQGKNGLCTVGWHVGCLCYVEECPPNDYVPSCVNCGGNDGSKHCLGLSKSQDLWKGCECIPDSKPDIYLVDDKIWEENRQIRLKVKAKPRPPYNQGECHVTLFQWDNTQVGKKTYPRTDPTNGWNSTYSVEAWITEAAKKGDYNYVRKVIGSSPRVSAGPLSTATWEVTKPLEIASLLEDKLVITPLKNGKNGPYIRFTLGGQTWSSNLKESPNDPRVFCDVKLQEWEWREIGGFLYQWEYRRVINCDFQCTWGGGKSSNAP